MYDGTGLSCANGTAKRMDYDTQDYDTDTMWDPGSPSRIAINTSGTYRVEMGVSLPSAAYTQVDINIRKNSGGASGGGTSLTTYNATGATGNTIDFQRIFDWPLVAGDYYEIFVTQTSGGARTTAAGNLATYAAFTLIRT